jgi:2-polyprenyl-3-methyl-5-hydroxy-6-metoxy-1,4-benzoquinol methylase
VRETSEIYDAWHARLEPDDEANAPWHQLARKYVDPVRDLKDRTVLEIGCGSGAFSVSLAKARAAPAKVVGADFSGVALKKAAELSAKMRISNIVWERQDILALSHPDASFDTVFSFETIEHVNEPARAVRELVRVLRPGGRLFLTTPNYFGVMGLYRMYLWLCGREFREVDQPINQLTMIPRTFYWLAAAGLHRTRVRCVGQYLPWPGRPAIRIMSLERVWPLEPFALHSFFLAEKKS